MRATKAARRWKGVEIALVGAAEKSGYRSWVEVWESATVRRNIGVDSRTDAATGRGDDCFLGDMRKEAATGAILGDAEL